LYPAEVNGKGAALKRRVVVTGLGLVLPNGIGFEKAWKNTCEGKSGIGRITRFDASSHETQIAGEVKGFSPEDYVDRKEVRRMDLFIQYAVGASTMALEDSGLEINEDISDRVGVIIGTGLGGLPTIEEYHKVLLERGPHKITPFFIPKLIANMASGYVAMHLNAKGPNTCVVTACATGAHAIGDAFRTIHYGDADVIITGGTEANITPLCVAGFNVMKAISTRNDEPEKASRPFDRDRDGFVISEGAGVLILEELGFALRREARIYAEIIGYGFNGDAYHITAPSPNGEGAAKCMRNALTDAGIGPDQIEYISAHGTSTQLNDLSETIAIKSVFAERAYEIPISATKSMTGHLLGAAGSTEAIFTILTLRDGIIPPTINLEHPDPQCDLDFVPNESREAEIHTAMSNSFGFGGTNAVLIFSTFNG
jgi:3-oxoacyl-[acyl-carrier-protein] synthase II